MSWEIVERAQSFTGKSITVAVNGGYEVITGPSPTVTFDALIDEAERRFGKRGKGSAETKPAANAEEAPAVEAKEEEPAVAEEKKKTTSTKKKRSSSSAAKKDKDKDKE